MSAYARPAPAVFPLPFHRSLDLVDAEEAKTGRAVDNLAKSAQQRFTVAKMFPSIEAGQKGVCRANPALTINAVVEREAMAPVMPLKGVLQPDSGGAG